MEIITLPRVSSVTGASVSPFRGNVSPADLELGEVHDPDTERVLYFYTPAVYKKIEHYIKHIGRSREATKAAFLCSSHILITARGFPPTIDSTGQMVGVVRFIKQEYFRVIPIGSSKSRLMRRPDVRGIILFGSQEWVDEMRSHCIAEQVNREFLENLFDDDDLRLKILSDVPVVGGSPTNTERSVSPRGFYLVGKKVELHIEVIEQLEDLSEKLTSLRAKVDLSAGSFKCPKHIGLVFGAIGQLQRGGRNSSRVDMCLELGSKFPRTPFIGLSSNRIFTGRFPYHEYRDAYLICIIVFEDTSS